MANIDFDCVIIGAGVVGLACAARLSRERSVLVLEAERGFGRHTSSRNSEVLHSGIYYPSGSLKAALCLEGNALTKAHCRRYEVPFKEVGKYLVAVDEADVPRLNALFDQGIHNGVQGLRRLSGKELPQGLSLRPVKEALWVPSAGIIDSHRFMSSLERISLDQGGSLVYGSPVARIEPKQRQYEVFTDQGDRVICRHLVNCAGLHAHEAAALAGIDILGHKITQHWCKGIYFKTTRLGNYPHLIYPIPPADGQSLGIHLTVNIEGRIRFGPDTEFVSTIDYRFPVDRKEVFEAAIMRYLDLPGLNLQEDDCGIRAKLQGPGDPFRDFYIREESDKGLPGFINLLGIESPGLTSALAIAEMVHSLLSND